MNLRAICPVLVVAALFASAAKAEAQWSLVESVTNTGAGERVSSVHFASANGATDTWDNSCPNWFWIIGSENGSPPWSNYYADLCSNNWEAGSPITMTVNSNYYYVTFEYFTEKWGHETFTNETQGAVMREMKYTGIENEGNSNSPGYHVTTSIITYSLPMSTGGGGGG